MDNRQPEDQVWELSTSISRSDRRHSSSASTSSKSAEDKSISSQPDASKSRRMRPSVSSASSQLATVREQQEFRTLSWDKLSKTSDALTPLKSEETVVSSKDVLRDFRKVVARDPVRERKRLEKLETYRAANKGQHNVYGRLKKRADYDMKRVKTWLPWLTLGRQPPLPTTDELLALARHYYPPRVRPKQYGPLTVL